MILQSIALSELLPLLFSLCISSLLPFSPLTSSRLTFSEFFPQKKCGNSLPLPTAPVCRSFERRTLKITIALLLINVNTIKKIFQ